MNMLILVNHVALAVDWFPVESFESLSLGYTVNDFDRLALVVDKGDNLHSSVHPRRLPLDGLAHACRNQSRDGRRIG